MQRQFNVRVHLALRAIYTSNPAKPACSNSCYATLAVGNTQVQLPRTRGYSTPTFDAPNRIKRRHTSTRRVTWFHTERGVKVVERSVAKRGRIQVGERRRRSGYTAQAYSHSLGLVEPYTENFTGRHYNQRRNSASPDR